MFFPTVSQKQALGWIPPSGCCLLTPALENGPRDSWGQRDKPQTHTACPTALPGEAICGQMSTHKSR